MSMNFTTSESTCFKSINRTCIDNFVTNKKNRSMKTLTFETGASDHHKLIGTMLRYILTTREPNTIFHHFYQNLKMKNLKMN